MRTVVAVDPDLHNSAFVRASKQRKKPRFKVEEVVVVGVDKSLKGDLAVQGMIEACADRAAGWGRRSDVVIEGQKINRPQHGGRADPQDILRLAQVAGGVAGAFSAGGHSIRLVPPAVWKGQVPKQDHQARTCYQLGWGCRRRGTSIRGYVVPKIPYSVEGTKHLLASEWKHVMDAIALAYWALFRERK